MSEDMRGCGASIILLADGRWTPTDTQILIRGEAQAFKKIWDEV